jgi:hypothetical protein
MGLFFIAFWGLMRIELMGAGILSLAQIKMLVWQKFYLNFSG